MQANSQEIIEDIFKDIFKNISITFIWDFVASEFRQVVKKIHCNA